MYTFSWKLLLFYGDYSHSIVSPTDSKYHFKYKIKSLFPLRKLSHMKNIS